MGYTMPLNVAELHNMLKLISKTKTSYVGNTQSKTHCNK